MIIVLLILAALLLALLYYAVRNLSLDDLRMKKVWAAGYSEKQVTLPNGTVLNYGESAGGGLPALLLLHGQGQAWQDYDLVLPELAGKFHVFSVDCHGHGKSSHDPARYTCKKMTEDFVWFAENVIKAPFTVTGHSSGGILATAVAASSPLASGLLIEDAPFFCVEPEEMLSHNAFVWESFKLMHDFLLQTEEKSCNAYTVRRSVLWGLFGNLKDTMALSIEKYEKKHPGKPLKLWYIPQSMLRGMYYSNDYDLRFGETFYDGSWFDGTDQAELLAGVRCPCTYIKAKTGYLKDGKMALGISREEAGGAVLCCANDDEDARRVEALIAGCRRVTTQSNDHLIHAKYPELFIEEAARLRCG